MKPWMWIVVGVLLEVVANVLLVWAVLGAVVLVLLEGDGEAEFSVRTVGMIILAVALGAALAVAGWRVLSSQESA